MDYSYIDRMQVGSNELKIKIDKLFGFMESNKFQGLDPIQYFLLGAQASLMQAYFNTLESRIEYEQIKKEGDSMAKKAVVKTEKAVVKPVAKKTAKKAKK